MARTRWIKRLLVGVAVVLVAILLASAGGLWMSSSTPDWYAGTRLADADRDAAALRFQAMLDAAQGRIAEAHAQQLIGVGTTNPSASTPEGIEIAFSAAELNAFFEKWSELYHWDAKIGHFMSEPRVGLVDGRLVLGGRVRNIEFIDGRFASVHFEPRMDDAGNLDLDLDKVLMGNLPMPQALWQSQKDRLMQAVERRLPPLQRAAKIDPVGDANTEAIAAAMGKLFLHVMRDQAGEPVVFIPLLTTGGTRNVPVRLTDVRVAADGEDAEPRLTLTVEAMTPQQRDAFLDRIREPAATETASTN